jgi:hypothetical protein
LDGNAERIVDTSLHTDDDLRTWLDGVDLLDKTVYPILD